MSKLYCQLLTLILLMFFLSLTTFAQNKPIKSDEPIKENPSSTPHFDSSKAFEQVRKQVAFGPHWAGSSAIKEVRSYLISELNSYGLEVKQDKFQAQTPNPKFPKVEMTNLTAVIPGQKEGIIIISSHYDTKWFPDEKFLGANDGCSSTGLLLELARVLAKSKPEYTIWLTFFDGEEAMNIEWQGTDHTYGSDHLANSLRAEAKTKQIKAMILLDMIGDSDLNIFRDGNSTGWLKDIIWNTAAELKYNKAFLNEPYDIEDDHIPFLKAGIASVDIIDFDYGPDNEFWHTDQDTLDKLSPESLKAVGESVLHSLPKIFNYLNKTTK